MTEGKQIYYHNLRENLRKMNPRFKELAIQAGAYEDGDSILTGPMDVAKFAELIVKETLQVARAGIEFGNGMEDAVYKYFGVEE